MGVGAVSGAPNIKSAGVVLGISFSGGASSFWFVNIKFSSANFFSKFVAIKAVFT
jgi:hypothetical protein